MDQVRLLSTASWVQRARRIGRRPARLLRMEADEGDKTANLPLPSKNAETLIPETPLDRDPNLDPHPNAPHDPLESDAPVPIPPSSFPRDIFRALEVVERDSTAIAESFNSLFSSLRLALSEVTSTSVEHMRCFNDAAGRLQESALEAATKGNRYINSCLRLNQEMRGIESLAIQLKILKRNVDALDLAVNRIVRLP